MTSFLALRAALPAWTCSASDGVDGVSEYLRFYQLDSLPGQHSIGWVVTPVGRVAVQGWTLPGSLETVVVVHGYYDHVGLYRHLIAGWLARGYSVLAFDLPGHGLSDGPRAVIGNFDDYAAALAAVLTEASRHLPLVLAVGQSTGCAVLLNYLMQGNPNPFRAMILLAPLLRPHRWATSGRMTYALLHRWISALPRRFTDNCHDAAFLAFCRERDPLQPRWLSVAWVSAMREWLLRFDGLPALSLPTLLVQGQQDKTVDWRYNVPAIMKKLLQGELQYLAEARHHLVNESPAIRAHLWQLIDDFIDHRRQESSRHA